MLSGKVTKPRRARAIPTIHYSEGHILEARGYGVKLFYVTAVSLRRMTVQELVLEPVYGLHNAWRIAQPLTLKDAQRRASYNQTHGWRVQCGERDVDRKPLMEHAWIEATAMGRWFCPNVEINYND